VRRKAGFALVELRSQQDCHLEVWSAETHRKAFEKAFGRKMRLHLRKSSARAA
jgi:hypothetical protein